jgi:quercetin dioxygenase-like cupin family protein
MIQYRAMRLYNWTTMQEEALNPLLARKVIHTENLTIARLHLQKLAVVPRHYHMNEQITMLERGKLRFVFDDEQKIMEAGDILQIPPHVPHMVEALEDSVAVDLFSPPREDWIRGDDTYLRK